MILLLRVIFCFLIATFQSSLFAEDEINISGHLKLKSVATSFSDNSLQEDLGARQGLLNDYNLRLKLDGNNDIFKVNIEGELNGIGGSSKRSIEAFNLGRPLLESDERRFLNLTTSEGTEEFTRNTRLDRANFVFGNEKSQIRVGRQAYSVGGGILFSVLDVFNPFLPLAYDREYKVGEDMVVFTYGLSANVSIEGLIVGRRDESGSITMSESSTASVLKADFNDLSLNLILANHRDRFFTGISVSK